MFIHTGTETRRCLSCIFFGNVGEISLFKSMLGGTVDLLIMHSSMHYEITTKSIQLFAESVQNPL